MKGKWRNSVSCSIKARQMCMAMNKASTCQWSQTHWRNNWMSQFLNCTNYFCSCLTFQSTKLWATHKPRMLTDNYRKEMHGSHIDLWNTSYRQSLNITWWVLLTTQGLYLKSNWGLLGDMFDAVKSTSVNIVATLPSGCWPLSMVCLKSHPNGLWSSMYKTGDCLDICLMLWKAFMLTELQHYVVGAAHCPWSCLKSNWAYLDTFDAVKSISANSQLLGGLHDRGVCLGISPANYLEYSLPTVYIKSKHGYFRKEPSLMRVSHTWNGCLEMFYLKFSLARCIAIYSNFKLKWFNKACKSCIL